MLDATDSYTFAVYLLLVWFLHSELCVICTSSIHAACTAFFKHNKTIHNAKTELTEPRSNRKVAVETFWIAYVGGETRRSRSESDKWRKGQVLQKGNRSSSSTRISFGRVHPRRRRVDSVAARIQGLIILRYWCHILCWFDLRFLYILYFLALR